jgi:hypothetical protein
MTVLDFLSVSINLPNVPAVVCPLYASSQTASAIAAAVGGVTVRLYPVLSLFVPTVTGLVTDPTAPVTLPTDPVTLPTAPVTLATTWLVLIVVPLRATAVVASVIFDQSTPAYPAVADADVTTVTVAGMHPVLLATKTTAT